MEENKEKTDRYLLSYHRDALIEILSDPDVNKHFSISINFLELFENDPNLGNKLLKNPEPSLQNWDCALLRTQNSLLNEERGQTVKIQVHCRIHGLPVCPELHRTLFPKNDDANKFLQIHGTVTRIANTKMLEYQREFVCAKCKFPMIVKADYEYRNVITPPKKCSDCGGSSLVSGDLNPEYCKDYQEIKMQENVSKLDVGSIPSWIWVTLEDDLVDSCKPGDHVTVCGVVKRRWDSLAMGKRIRIELAVRANHVQVNNSNSTSLAVASESKAMFDGFWKSYAKKPLAARDIILKSICPQLFGMHMVKLAVAVTLAGGSQNSDGGSSSDMKIRSEPHLLLVGDPGTGKSQILRFASKIIPRSVLTTGVGSTAAGLTATAVMEDGQWQLEGGALVLSDGGICCIDEFNSMKEQDRISIHEAMEQQTISVAKASIVCTLSTKCSIIAATNPKGNIDPSQPLSINIALPSPLMSRFDLILLVRDKVDVNRDSLIADYIMAPKCSKLELHWSSEMLQAYFAIIKKKNPKLSDEANKILSEYYQAQRRNHNRNKSRTTVRLLDSLVRLSQGHAKLMYHSDVEVVDVVFAIALVETSMDKEFSLFDLNFDVQSDFPTGPLRSYTELASVILSRLNLQNILRDELGKVENDMDVEDNPPGRSDSANVKHVESKYFRNGSNETGSRTDGASSKKSVEQGGESSSSGSKGDALTTKNKSNKRKDANRSESNSGDEQEEESLGRKVNALDVNKKNKIGKKKDVSRRENVQSGNSDVGLEETDQDLNLDLPANEVNVIKLKKNHRQSMSRSATNDRKRPAQATGKTNNLSSPQRKTEEKNCDQKSKRFKFNPKKSEVANDMQMINLIPSVNDGFPLNDIFDVSNFDDDTEIGSEIQPNFESTRLDFVDDRLKANTSSIDNEERLPKPSQKRISVPECSGIEVTSVQKVSQIVKRTGYSRKSVLDSSERTREDHSRSSEETSVDEKRERQKKRLSKFRFVPKEPEPVKETVPVKKPEPVEETEPVKEPELPKEPLRKDDSTIFESQLDDADLDI